MTSKQRPLNAKVALNLRLPADLHRQLEQAAKRNGHSLNSEIVRRLEHLEIRLESMIDFASWLLRRAADGQQAQAMAARTTADERGNLDHDDVAHVAPGSGETP